MDSYGSIEATWYPESGTIVWCAENGNRGVVSTRARTFGGAFRRFRAQMGVRLTRASSYSFALAEG